MVAVLALALVACILVYFSIARKFNIVDRPSERSSHKGVVIRGAGIVFYMGVLLWSVYEGLPYPWFLMGLTVVTAVSFWDDLGKAPVITRLLLQVVGLTCMLYDWHSFSALPMGYSLVVLVLCTGFINIYNFMDGINGITAVYSLVTLGTLAWVNFFFYPFADMGLILASGIALLVFAFFNFRTGARCFAGDVGAISMAFIIAFLAGRLIYFTSDYTYLVFLTVYGADSFLTILHRLTRKQDVIEAAHREHAYQIMANELHLPHPLVASIYGAIQLLINAGYLLLPLNKHLYFALIVIALTIAWLLFMKKYYKLHAQSLSS